MNLRPLVTLISFSLFFNLTSSAKNIAEIHISHKSGHYNKSFNLDLSTQIPDATIIYTLDGSNPQTSKSAISKGTSASVTINPNNSKRRSLTPAVILRVSIDNGTDISPPIARTFIFMDKVKTQNRPDRSWPASSSLGQTIDYNMNPLFCKDSLSTDAIDQALIDLPTISVTTAGANLFNRQTGIYVNTPHNDKESERACAVELLDYKGTKGFNINAGLRINGDSSFQSPFSKHSFSLFFRKKYGKKKLKYPLFGANKMASFDQLDINALQKMSPTKSEGVHTSFIRDELAKTSQGNLGHAYTESRYYHLYLNGMYWGIYQIQEKADANFAAHYWGGSSDDYDLIKNSKQPNTVGYSKLLEASDGTMDKWGEIYELSINGFEFNQDYFFLEGKDENGICINGAEVFVDIDNLIDYMITMLYMGRYNASALQWSNKHAYNNVLAITHRKDKSQGFRFIIQDAEYSLIDNLLNLDDSLTVANQQAKNASLFSPLDLHNELLLNEEYLTRFSDRAYHQLTGNGIFTPHNSQERLNKGVKAIETALIAESARWSDVSDSSYLNRNKESGWATEINYTRKNLRFRTDTLIKQLADCHLFPLIEGPQLINSDNTSTTGFVDLNDAIKLSFTNPYGEGHIYYTTDGTDPRQIGGELAPSARKIKKGKQLIIKQSTIIQARILYDDTWGALMKVSFLTKQTDFYNLKVTELNYHPKGECVDGDTLKASKYEFIEFRNTSSTASINLTGLSIDSGIHYSFPDNYLLAPKAYFVVAAKPRYFFERYGVVASGNYSKKLSNRSERIVVNNNEGAPIIDFTYTDGQTKLSNADGDGPTLSSVSETPTEEPNTSTYWRLSTAIHGTPYTSDAPVLVPDKELIKVYPNPTTNVVNISIPEYDGSFSQAMLYDVSGSLVYHTKFMSRTSILFYSLHVQSGVYILKVKSGNHSETKKIVYTSR